MRIARYLIPAVATAVTLLVACSNDGGLSRPVADTVPPNPPVGVQAVAEDGAVLITWSENAEFDLAGYRLYRSCYRDGPFGQVSSRLLFCPWFYDQVVPAAATYYKVTAVDESGNESAFSELAGIYSNNDRKPKPEAPAS